MKTDQTQGNFCYCSDYSLNLCLFVCFKLSSPTYVHNLVCSYVHVVLINHAAYSEVLDKYFFL